MRAHRLLAEAGVAAEVIDPISLVPLDIEAIVRSAQRTGRLIVVDNAWTSCGASAEIVAAVLEQVGPDGGIAVARIGFAPTTCPTTPTLERAFYPNPGRDRRKSLRHGPSPGANLDTGSRAGRTHLPDAVPRAVLMDYELATGNWDNEELVAISRVIESGRFTMGDQVRSFEAAFAQYFGKSHAVMVNSGSSANLASVAALSYKRERPLQRGDEVIVPAISWSTTFHPLQQYGLKLKFVDVELDTLNMDCSRLEAALGPRTRMIVAVNILGNPAALDRIRAFADRHGLYMLEDNCESADAELNGQKTGTFGDLNTFSFFFSHHVSTMEGGMVLTDNEELHHLLLSLRAHG